MSLSNPSSSGHRLRHAFFACCGVLLLRIFVGILWQYWDYFPPNFDSAFLSGRLRTFHGTYAAAFYTHIICGPICILLAVVSLLTGLRARWPVLHRILGRLQFLLTVIVLLPSGLVMAWDSYGGPIAGLGFGFLTIFTAVAVLATVYTARQGRICAHRLWAVRTAILLMSPLLFRLISGITIVTNTEAEWIYRTNAWVSWLLPIVVYEIAFARFNFGREPVSTNSR